MQNPAEAGRLARPEGVPLKYVEIVITRSDNTRCRRLSAESFRWSGVQCDALAIGRASATSVYEFQLMLYTASQSGIRLRDLTAGAVSVSALVVLTGCLPGNSEAGSDLRPSNAQADRLIDQRCEFGLCLVPAESGVFDPLQHLG